MNWLLLIINYIKKFISGLVAVIFSFILWWICLDKLDIPWKIAYVFIAIVTFNVSFIVDYVIKYQARENEKQD